MRDKSNKWKVSLKFSFDPGTILVGVLFHCDKAVRYVQPDNSEDSENDVKVEQHIFTIFIHLLPMVLIRISLRTPFKIA